MNLKTLILITITLMIIIVIYKNYDYVDPKNILSSHIDKEVPEVELFSKDLNKTVSSKTLPDNAIYYIFSPTCKYCIKQHTNISKLKENIPTIRHVGISWYQNDKVSEEWINKHAKNLFDEVYYLHSDKLSGELDLYAVPHTLVIKESKIKFQSIGLLNNKVIQKHILPIFEHK